MKRILVILICVLALAGCSAASEAPSGAGGSTKRAAVISGELQFANPLPGDIVANIETDRGNIHVLLYAKYAPLAVENFRGLAQQGYFNSTSIHRVVKDFLIQGGDPSGTGLGGNSLWGTPFGTERSDMLRHYAGALCMATGDGKENENGSQFYILASPQGNITEDAAQRLAADGVREGAVEAYRQAGGEPYLDNTDTVFGQVYAGMDVVDTISRIAAGEDERPSAGVKILSITVGSYVKGDEASGSSSSASSSSSAG